MTEEIIPGYNEYRQSLFEKLVEPMDSYLLCKLKLDQLKKRDSQPETMQLIDNEMMAAKDRIAEILIQEKDLDWVKI